MFSHYFVRKPSSCLLHRNVHPDADCLHRMICLCCIVGCGHHSKGCVATWVALSLESWKDTDVAFNSARAAIAAAAVAMPTLCRCYCTASTDVAANDETPLEMLRDDGVIGLDRRLTKGYTLCYTQPSGRCPSPALSPTRLVMTSYPMT